MPLTLMQPSSALRPHEADPDINSFDKRILAQGDSWFSFGSIPPWSTGNLLNELNFRQNVVAVNCGYPGTELSEMVEASPEFRELMAGDFQIDNLNAIIVSGGGNDLIAALRAELPRYTVPLLLPQGKWGNQQDVSKYVNPAQKQNLINVLTTSLNAIIDLRKRGGNENVPILIHNYAYAMPRNAPAAPGVGPWLYGAVIAAGVPPIDWENLSQELIGMITSVYQTFASTPGSNVYLVDTAGSGLLDPAAQGSTGANGFWENEIHPTPDGYKRLATVWETALDARGIT